MNPEIPFLNIHSHKECQQGEWNIFSLDAADLSKIIPEHKFLSCGIHPWFITSRWKEDFEHLKALWQQPHTLFVGECGLDPNSSHPMSLQEEVFRMQAEWAADYSPAQATASPRSVGDPWLSRQASTDAILASSRLLCQFRKTFQSGIRGYLPRRTLLYRN